MITIEYRVKSPLLMMHTSYMSKPGNVYSINHSHWAPPAEDLISVEFLHLDHSIAEVACHLWKSASPNPWADCSWMCPGSDCLQVWAPFASLCNLFQCLTTLSANLHLCLLSLTEGSGSLFFSHCLCRYLHTLLSFPWAFPSQDLQCRSWIVLFV